MHSLFYACFSLMHTFFFSIVLTRDIGKLMIILIHIMCDTNKAFCLYASQKFSRIFPFLFCLWECISSPFLCCSDFRNIFLHLICRDYFQFDSESKRNFHVLMNLKRLFFFFNLHKQKQTLHFKLFCEKIIEV